MNVALNLPVGARLQNFWQVWQNLGTSLRVVQILREGYTLPFRIRPKLVRFPTVMSCYINPHRNSYLMEALHQLTDKNAVEVVQNQKSVGFFNRLFLVPKPNNKWRPILDQSNLNLFLKVSSGEDTGNHQNLPANGGMGNLDRFQRCLLPYPHTGTIQEISKIPCSGTDSSRHCPSVYLQLPWSSLS